MKGIIAGIILGGLSVICIIYCVYVVYKESKLGRLTEKEEQERKEKEILQFKKELEKYAQSLEKKSVNGSMEKVDQGGDSQAELAEKSSFNDLQEIANDITDYKDDGHKHKILHSQDKVQAQD